MHIGFDRSIFLATEETVVIFRLAIAIAVVVSLNCTQLIADLVGGLHCGRDSVFASLQTIGISKTSAKFNRSFRRAASPACRNCKVCCVNMELDARVLQFQNRICQS